MPEIPGVECTALEMQHAVVFGNDMNVASAPSHAHQLGDHPVRVWDGMNDVAAHGEVVAQVGCGKRVCPSALGELAEPTGCKLP